MLSEIKLVNGYDHMKVGDIKRNGLPIKYYMMTAVKLNENLQFLKRINHDQTQYFAELGRIGHGQKSEQMVFRGSWRPESLG